MLIKHWIGWCVVLTVLCLTRSVHSQNYGTQGGYGSQPAQHQASPRGDFYGGQQPHTQGYGANSQFEARPPSQHQASPRGDFYGGQQPQTQGSGANSQFDVQPSSQHGAASMGYNGGYGADAANGYSGGNPTYGGDRLPGNHGSPYDFSGANNGAASAYNQPVAGGGQANAYGYSPRGNQASASAGAIPNYGYAGRNDGQFNNAPFSSVPKTQGSAFGNYQNQNQNQNYGFPTSNSQVAGNAYGFEAANPNNQRPNANSYAPRGQQSRFGNLRGQNNGADPRYGYAQSQPSFGNSPPSTSGFGQANQGFQRAAGVGPIAQQATNQFQQNRGQQFQSARTNAFLEEQPRTEQRLPQQSPQQSPSLQQQMAQQSQLLREHRAKLMEQQQQQHQQPQQQQQQAQLQPQQQPQEQQSKEPKPRVPTAAERAESLSRREKLRLQILKRRYGKIPATPEPSITQNTSTPAPSQQEEPQPSVNTDSEPRLNIDPQPSLNIDPQPSLNKDPQDNPLVTAHTEDAPAHTEDAPAHTEDAPAHTEDAPAHTEDAHSQRKKALHGIITMFHEEVKHGLAEGLSPEYIAKLTREMSAASEFRFGSQPSARSIPSVQPEVENKPEQWQSAGAFESIIKRAVIPTMRETLTDIEQRSSKTMDDCKKCTIEQAANGNAERGMDDNGLEDGQGIAPSDETKTLTDGELISLQTNEEAELGGALGEDKEAKKVKDGIPLAKEELSVEGVPGKQPGKIEKVFQHLKQRPVDEENGAEKDRWERIPDEADTKENPAEGQQQLDDKEQLGDTEEVLLDVIEPKKIPDEVDGDEDGSGDLD